MSQNQRLCFLSLLVVLMFWAAPATAAYYDDYGNGCPVLAVPFDLDDNNNVWTDSNRNLWPWEANAYIEYSPDFRDFDYDGCVLYVGAGTYYDEAGHIWTLDDAVSCSTRQVGPWDFRGGDSY